MSHTVYKGRITIKILKNQGSAKRMKKLIAILMLGLVLFIAACNDEGDPEETNSAAESESTEASAEGSEASEEKQTVTFWHSMGGAGQEALNAIVDSYNSSQDAVQVNAEYQGTYDEALTKFNSVAGTDSAQR
jgi:sn-glycerol 3-phosphate transport system substrate-binding protein